MANQPEIQIIKQRRIACDGATDVPGGTVLGHPRVWLEIDASGMVECGYCDKRFILAAGPADTHGH
jgi:NADH dehydrogenase (ubiquinone) Fe-S protein 6